MRDLEWLKEGVQEKLLEDKLDGINYFDYKRLKEDIWGLIDQVEVQERSDKPEIPRYVGVWLDRLEDLSLDELLDTLYMPNNDDVHKWLYDNDEEENQRRELAIVKARVHGYTLEEEKKFIVVNRHQQNLLIKVQNTVQVFNEDSSYHLIEHTFGLTEKEIKDFDENYWVFAEPI